MKKWLISDEWYPVYSLEDKTYKDSGREVEVDEAFVKECERIEAEFTAMQARLAALDR